MEAQLSLSSHVSSEELFTMALSLKSEDNPANLTGLPWESNPQPSPTTFTHTSCLVRVLLCSARPQSRSSSCPAASGSLTRELLQAPGPLASGWLGPWKATQLVGRGWGSSPCPDSAHNWASMLAPALKRGLVPLFNFSGLR